MTDDGLEDLLRDAARSYHQPPDIPREAMWAAIERARGERTAVPITRGRGSSRWLAVAAGVAAVLLLGIGIGRMSRNTALQPAVEASTQSGASAFTSVSSASQDLPPANATPDYTVTRSRSAVPAARRIAARVGASPEGRDAASDRASAADIAGDQSAYRSAVVEHLARTEVLLAGFRSQVRSGAGARVDAQFASLSRDLLGTTRLLLATRRSDDPATTRLLQDLELVLMQLTQYANDGRRTDLDAVEASIEKHNVMPKLRSTIPAGSSTTSGT